MNKEEFSKVYRYMDNEDIAYIVVKKSKILHTTETRKLIIQELSKIPENLVMKVNVNVTRQGFSPLMSLSNSNKFNSYLIKHSVFLPIVERMGLNIDRLIFEKDVIVKPIINVKSQEKRKIESIERRKLKGEIVSNCGVDKPMLSWIKDRNKNLTSKTTSYEDKVYNRLRKTFKKKVTRQHPFVINGKSYFADICIKCKKVVVEIDGGYHFTDEQKEKDRQRDEAFNYIGYTTIRMTNEQVKDGKSIKELVEKLLSIPNVGKLKKKKLKGVNGKAK